MGFKLNMHIKLINKVIHTHGYNTGIMPGLSTPFCLLKIFAIIPHLPTNTVYLKLLIFDIRNFILTRCVQTHSMYGA